MSILELIAEILVGMLKTLAMTKEVAEGITDHEAEGGKL
jgi:hypothetical protein